MPDRDTWEKRIKLAERQFYTVRFGMVRLRADLARDITIGHQSPKQLSIEDSEDDLEATYFVRMFADYGRFGKLAEEKNVKQGRKPANS
ncbi:MAG: hypothetical protein K2X38_23135 [Gemmataceae bacterium]|nr:hypothetical protein [Gemmataceae bacterium]